MNQPREPDKQVWLGGGLGRPTALEFYRVVQSLPGALTGSKDLVAEVLTISKPKLCHFDRTKANQIDVKHTILLQCPFKSQDLSQWNTRY